MLLLFHRKSIFQKLMRLPLMQRLSPLFHRSISRRRRLSRLTERIFQLHRVIRQEWETLRDSILKWNLLKAFSTNSTSFLNVPLAPVFSQTSTVASWWSDLPNKVATRSAWSSSKWLSSRVLAREEVSTEISRKLVELLEIDRCQVHLGLCRGLRKIRDRSVDMYRWGHRLEISLQLQEGKHTFTNIQT